MAPRPLQTPRIPVIAAGYWPHRKPFRRAARWDGAFPLSSEQRDLSPAEIGECVAFMREVRQGDAPFEVLHQRFLGLPAPGDEALRLDAYAAAGVTWWTTGFVGGSLAEVLDAVRQGPPGGA
jgi:hypothetical protein